jgi:hypothetical protein
MYFWKVNPSSYNLMSIFWPCSTRKGQNNPKPIHCCECFRSNLAWWRRVDVLTVSTFALLSGSEHLRQTGSIISTQLDREERKHSPSPSLWGFSLLLVMRHLTTPQRTCSRCWCVETVWIIIQLPQVRWGDKHKQTVRKLLQFLSQKFLCAQNELHFMHSELLAFVSVMKSVEITKLLPVHYIRSPFNIFQIVTISSCNLSCDDIAFLKIEHEMRYFRML